MSSSFEIYSKVDTSFFSLCYFSNQKTQIEEKGFPDSRNIVDKIKPCSMKLSNWKERIREQEQEEQEQENLKLRRSKIKVSVLFFLPVSFLALRLFISLILLSVFVILALPQKIQVVEMANGTPSKTDARKLG